jgi:hypothetical protein
VHYFVSSSFAFEGLAYKPVADSVHDYTVILSVVSDSFILIFLPFSVHIKHSLETYFIYMYVHPSLSQYTHTQLTHREILCECKEQFAGASIKGYKHKNNNQNVIAAFRPVLNITCNLEKLSLQP